MKKRSNFLKELYEEASDIKFRLCYNADEVSEKSLEKRYKIVVMTILPILLSLVRSIFFMLSGIVGFLLGRHNGSFL